jgi:hypothetical protein
MLTIQKRDFCVVNSNILGIIHDTNSRFSASLGNIAVRNYLDLIIKNHLFVRMSWIKTIKKKAKNSQSLMP